MSANTPKKVPEETVGSALARHKGEGPGFLVLRYALAIMIFALHAKALSHPTLAAIATPAGALPQEGPGWDGPMRPIYVVLVPAFFALSGFLVAGSALRLRSTATFLSFRALRIFPALTVEVTLSALLLGPLLTTLPLRTYFSDPQFFRYFGNIVGWITFYLPGLFQENSTNLVNVNLWTLPSEFDCYAVTAVLLIFGIIYKKSLLTVLVVVATVIFIILNGFSDFAVEPWHLAGHTVTYYFFVGLLFFLWKDRIPLRWSLFAICAAASYGLLYSRHTIYLAPPFVVYCTIFLGVAGLPELKWLKGKDYSYGIYLYGYPIIQATLCIAPWLRGYAIEVGVISLTTTVLFAALSWTFIEKPALQLKKRVPQISAARLNSVIWPLTAWRGLLPDGRVREELQKCEELQK
jgi:peptidoglycan/LPS O-acetylase OafA/YrhL